MKRASSAPSSSPYSKHLVERPSRRLRSFLLWALLAALRTAIIVARDANALLRRSELLILEMALDGRRLTKRESMWFFYRYPSFSGGRGGGVSGAQRSPYPVPSLRPTLYLSSSIFILGDRFKMEKEGWIYDIAPHAVAHDQSRLIYLSLSIPCVLQAQKRTVYRCSRCTSCLTSVNK